MKVITGKSVGILLSAADNEGSEISLIYGLIMCEPDVTIDPVDAAFCLQTSENRIVPDYIINDSLYKLGEILAGCFIAGTVFSKPEPVIMPVKVIKKLNGRTVNSDHTILRLIRLI